MDDASVDFHKKVLYFICFLFDDCILWVLKLLSVPSLYVYMLYAH